MLIMMSIFAWMMIIPCLVMLTPAHASGIGETVVIRTQEFPHALRNPLKGFRTDRCDGRHEYATLCRTYLKWNELERDASDGIERIREVCNRRWSEVEKHNVKVIPRVYLHWEKEDEKYWPADMQPGDYSSDQFKARVKRLIARLGQCWDNDPRVAWVQMGIIGKWGEHHSPEVTPEMQRILGDAFTAAFRHKMVTVRHPWNFRGYTFGIYWDSWGHVQEIEEHGKGIAALGDRWKIRPIGGECAYNWGRWWERLGRTPDDTLREARYRNYLIDTIRWLHGTSLGWVADYTGAYGEKPGEPKIRAGAEEVQKTFGYRFILEEVRYPVTLPAQGVFSVTFKVRNVGSAPFYYRWPVELCLLDPASRQVVWRDTFQDVDIRQWLPGDRWNWETHAYEQKPETHTVRGTFQIPPALQRGKYALALAILDPAGMVPSCRFAIRDYFRGGRHPIGYVGVGVSVPEPQIDPEYFDDPAQDDTLHYELGNTPSYPSRRNELSP